MANSQEKGMTKRDLVVRIADQTNLNQREVADIVQKTFDTIINELGAGRSLEFRNFGVFELNQRKPRIGRNPNRPEETVEIPARTVVKFKPGKVLQEKIEKLDESGSQ
ncbi:MAG: HU family DNA-binding protein [Verrucomicrobiota bacterium]